MAERREQHPERVVVRVAGTCYRADHPPSILVARRAEDRELCPGMWEGCGGQLRPDETFTEGVARHFREELGIDVEVLDQYLLYDIPTPAGTIPGIRFLCRYQGGEARSPNHTEVRWLSWEAFLALPAAECVPGLQRDVERLVGRLVSPLADDIAAWRRYASSAARESSTYGGREMVALAVRTADALEGMGRLEAEVRRLRKPLRPGAPPLLQVGPMGIDGREHVYAASPGGTFRTGVPAEEVGSVAALLREAGCGPEGT